MASDYHSRNSPVIGISSMNNGQAKLTKGKLLPKVRLLDIIFGNDSLSQPGLYLSGSTLTGTVRLEIIKPISIVRVRIICEGLVRVFDTKKVVLSSNEILFGTREGRKEAVKMPAGIRSYDFSINLPADLPTTVFKSELLKANYKCMALVIRKTSSDDIVVERPFIVHSVTDGIYEQVSLGQECSEKPLQFNGMNSLISLPKTGLFLGDNLLVSALVENPTQTSRRVKIGVRVVRKIVGHGALDFGLIKVNQTKNFLTVVTDRWSKFFKVPKRGNKGFEVEVPLNLMEPTTKHTLIDIEYLAHVSFITQGVLSDSKAKSVTFSITIAPPTSLAQYPISYATIAPEMSYPEFQVDPTTSGTNSNDLGAGMVANIYPTLDAALVSAMRYDLEPSAPELEASDEDNESVILPSYEDVIAGKV
ncbi:uncharacterized protein [Watersipora subatra]|uniref:uncharacterized protein n=1 Tax=Watersipora subatra TaxID=2589382 RepID=UPI00355BFDD1